jgi:UDP-N-acetylmuramoylalanine--D-glutamate ligase
LNHKLTILGGGESGAGAAVLAMRRGLDVFVSDAGRLKDKYRAWLEADGVPYEEGGHSADRLLQADEVVISPGIPHRVDIVQQIKKKGIPLISDIELAGRYMGYAKRICITGSNGKTTTTNLIHHMFVEAGVKAALSGNVGNSLCYQVAQGGYELYVVEVSNFQLDGMYDFRADTAILLNITPDHLDRYAGFGDYARSKFRILQNMRPQDSFIYWAEDQVIRGLIEEKGVVPGAYPFAWEGPLEQGAWTEKGKFIIKTNKSSIDMTIEELALQGRHNAYNSMAAGITGSLYNLRKEVIRESLADFQGVEHRLEFALSVHGIEFINDSKATNVNSTWYALESQRNPVVWIAGGVDKGNDYEKLKDLVKAKVKGIVCIGKDNFKIHQAFSDLFLKIVDVESMNEAVYQAYRMAQKGDTVLLSPACASFDRFDNYEQRGQEFKAAVRGL